MQDRKKTAIVDMSKAKLNYFSTLQDSKNQPASYQAANLSQTAALSDSDF